MTRSRSCLSWLLVLALVFNPLLFEAAVWAEGSGGTGSTMSGAQQEVTQGNQKVQDLEEIKMSAVKKFVLGIGSWLKGKSWGYYEKKIKDANAKIREAKTTTAVATQKTNTAASTHQSSSVSGAGVKSSVGTTASAKAELQKAMMEIGTQLQEIATIIQAVGAVLIAVGIATSWLGGAGTLISGVGKVLMGVAGALKKAGAAIYAAGQKGATGDSDFFKVLGEAAKGYAEGYKTGGNMTTVAKTAIDQVSANGGGWFDKVKSGLGAMGENGKKGLEYVNKGEAAVKKGVSIWEKTKEKVGWAWNSAKTWVVGPETQEMPVGTSTAEGTTVTVPATPAAPETPAPTGETTTESVTTSGEGTSTSTGPEASGDPSGGFIGE